VALQVISDGGRPWPLANGHFETSNHQPDASGKAAAHRPPGPRRAAKDLAADRLRPFLFSAAQ